MSTKQIEDPAASPDSVSADPATSERKDDAVVTSAPENRPSIGPSEARGSESSLTHSGRERRESLREKVLLSSIVAALSFLGAVGGTMVTSMYQESRWKREARLTYDQAIFNKRVELLDQTARIINRSHSAERMDNYIDNLVLSGFRNTKNNDEDQFQSQLEKVVEAALKRDELNVEFATVMSLDGLYFGPKTDRAIMNLAKAEPDWWDADESLFKAVLNALGEEVMWGISPRPPE